MLTIQRFYPVDVGGRRSFGQPHAGLCERNQHGVEQYVDDRARHAGAIGCFGVASGFGTDEDETGDR